MEATEWQSPVFVMDCDAVVAFDHVSHHEIIKAALAMGVPPVLIAAWIREYRNSETIVKLDDIVTPGSRRTRSVPHGDPCAPDLFGAALDTPAVTCAKKKVGMPVGNGYLGLRFLADNCCVIAMSPGGLQTTARAWKELLELLSAWDRPGSQTSPRTCGGALDPRFWVW